MNKEYKHRYYLYGQRGPMSDYVIYFDDLDALKVEAYHRLMVGYVAYYFDNETGEDKELKIKP